MQKEIEITVAPEHVANEQVIRQNLARKLNVDLRLLKNIRF